MLDVVKLPASVRRKIVWSCNSMKSLRNNFAQQFYVIYDRQIFPDHSYAILRSSPT